MSRVKEKIALVAANGLGDGLLTLVMAHNLQNAGYTVTTFSNYLMQLHSWFPGKQIQAFPSIEVVDTIFCDYDKIISTDGAFLSRIKHNLGNKYKIFYEHDFGRHKSVLQNFLDICRHEFSLEQVTEENGLMVPEGLQFRKFPNRVIIHPMSTSGTKNWLPKKFIKLAEKLQQRNFIPVFAVSPKEFSHWQKMLQQQFLLPLFPSVDDLAKFVYESGYMIGNDSGIGHLASNLGIPTLSLFARQKVANLWRPSWGNKGIVVTPGFQLPGARLRTKYWKNFLTVRRVFAEFEKLTKYM